MGSAIEGLNVDRRWRISMQEKALRLLDFTTVDTLIQVHDYDGLGMSSRDANSKRAATEASKIFQDYYPETLVGEIASSSHFLN